VGGSAPNRDDPILLAHVATSELSDEHVLDLPVLITHVADFGICTTVNYFLK